MRAKRAHGGGPSPQLPQELASLHVLSIAQICANHAGRALTPPSATRHNAHSASSRALRRGGIAGRPATEIRRTSDKTRSPSALARRNACKSAAAVRAEQSTG